MFLAVYSADLMTVIDIDIFTARPAIEMGCCKCT